MMKGTNYTSATWTRVTNENAHNWREVRIYAKSGNAVTYEVLSVKRVVDRLKATVETELKLKRLDRGTLHYVRPEPPSKFSKIN